MHDSGARLTCAAFGFLLCVCAGAQTFQAPPTPVPHRPPPLAGDFNGDGRLDLLRYPGTLFPGDGDGNFGAESPLVWTGGPPLHDPSGHFAVADFDQNGYDDLVVGEQLGISGVHFGPACATTDSLAGFNVGPAVGDGLYRPVAADLDGDGLPDLVVTSLGTGPNLYAPIATQPRIVHNLGGGFAFFPAIPVTTAATHTFVADADADGLLDIIVVQNPGAIAVSPSAYVVVIRQSVPGSFGAVVASPLTLAPGWSDVAIGDVDADGRPDLYVAWAGGASTLLRNVGGCMFAAQAGHAGTAPGVEVRLVDVDGNATDELVEIENGSRVRIFAFAGGAWAGPMQVIGPSLETPAPGETIFTTSPFVADLDGDGHRDLVGPGIAVLLNHGHGGFTQSSDRLAPGLDYGVHRVGDVDGDGFPDIFCVWRRRLTVGLNDGSGRWTLAPISAPVLPSSGSNGSAFVEPFDFDGDGDLDLYYANQSSPGAGLQDMLLRNDGNLTWSPLITRPSTGDVSRVIPVDVDGDSDQDLVLFQTWPLGTALLGLKNENGTNLVPWTIWQTDAVIRGCVPVDIDRDGDLDLFVTTAATNFDPQLVRSTVLVNDGNGVFTALPSFPPVTSDDPLAGDLDGDGTADLVAGGTVLLNQGSSFLAIDVWPATNVSPRAIVDIDRDGDLDVLMQRGSELRTYANSGTGSFTLVETTIVPAPFYPALPAPADLDRDGDLDLDYRIMNVSHQLARKDLPRIGRASTKRLHAPPGTPYALYVSLGRGELPVPPYGTVFLDLATLAQIGQGVTSATGTADFTVTIPNVPQFVGVAVNWQAVFFDGPVLSGLEASVVGY